MAGGGGGPKVLLVDDNVTFGLLVREILSRGPAGEFQLLIATDLAQGLQILKDGVDVVLLDLGLPDNAGFDTFAETYAQFPETPIIILTCLDDEELANRAVSEGAQDYLLKNEVGENILPRSIKYAMERASIQKSLRELSAALLRLQDEERRRIARDLHDTTAQQLAGLAMNLSHLATMAEKLPPKARKLLSASIDLVEQCSTDVRTTAYLLHPPLLDELGLAGAVRDYSDGFAERSGIRVDLELPHDLPRLSTEVETTLFRVMQESLTNIHRHSGSSKASVSLAMTGDAITLCVEDKGTGIPPDKMPRSQGATTGMGVGIAGMRERMRQLDGRLQIQTGPAGTTVLAILPLHSPTP